MAGKKLKPGQVRRMPSPLLRDYRWVREHPEGGAGTAFQKVLQKLLAEKPLEFMDRYQRAESQTGSLRGVRADSARQEDGSAGTAAEPESVDEGSERVEALIEQLLAGWKP